MTLLSRDQILSASDMVHEDVSVPEWPGGLVRVRTMTGSERDQYEQDLVRARGKDQKANVENVRALLLAYTIVDKDGNLLFSQSDVQALGKKSIKAIERVFSVASRLNALNEADVEDLAGNSDAAQSGDSTTG